MPSVEHDDGLVVYFSSVSGNTTKFVEKLGVRNVRIPLLSHEEDLVVDEEYVLIMPSYGAGKIKSAVPKQVIKFLNNETNRNYLRGIIGSGNTNYGNAYCIAAHIVSEKTGVPILYTYELLGLPEDVAQVQKGLKEFWETHRHQTH